MENKFEKKEKISEIELKKISLEEIDATLLEVSKMKKTQTYSLPTRNEIENYIKNGAFYIIEANNQKVGYISYEIKQDNHVYISEVGVFEEFQGRGVGRLAMQKILQELKDVKHFDLVAHPENTRAVGLYSSLGFKQAGEPIENYFGDGEPRIKMILQK